MMAGPDQNLNPLSNLIESAFLGGQPMGQQGQISSPFGANLPGGPSREEILRQLFRSRLGPSPVDLGAAGAAQAFSPVSTNKLAEK